jgi:hypothetical protein
MTMGGAVRVDGKAYAFLGDASNFGGASLSQVQKVANPTTTIYIFAGAGVRLQIAFSSIVDQVAVETEISRPYSYVTISVNNTDTKPHAVQVYFDCGADWVLDVNFNSRQSIQWMDLTVDDSANWVAHMWKTFDNIPFSEKGDYIKMNWGAAWMASKPDPRLSHTLASLAGNRAAFTANQPLPPTDTAGVRYYSTDPISSAFVWEFGTITPNQQTGCFFLIAYDDVFSMDYFGEYQRPLWRKTFNNDAHAMILDGLNSFDTIIGRLMAFDSQMLVDLRNAGGDAYAALTAIAYRQVTAGIKAVWSDATQQSLWYMKEISSDGDVSTVDVIYPASPFFIAYAPDILRKMLIPVLDYGLNRTSIPYNLPWAPHHLGFWPVSDIAPAQQEQMPMEESGNLLLMLAAIAQQQKGDVAWLTPYWPALQTWADYLVAALPDPGNQLCTDDFEGPSPHNVNLALKGIVGLGAWSQLLNYAGQTSAAKTALSQADSFATQWIAMNLDGAGNHTRLQYDLPGTWSQKYNMLFHSLLNMDIFQPSIMEQEIAFYKTVTNNQWGLPLDSRGPLTKSDWSSWIAAMSNDTTYSQLIFDLEWKFLTQGPSKGVPFSDFFSTADGHVLGFRARPVQGGLFAKYLMTLLQK